MILRHQNTAALGRIRRRRARQPAALRTRSAFLSGAAIGGMLGLVSACHAGAPSVENHAGGGSPPTGLYVLEAAVGAQTVPVRLELLSIGGRPWGRMTVMAGRPIVSAVRGTDRAGETWNFVVGGPVRALRLEFSDEGVTGTIVLGGGPPIRVEGQRDGPVEAADALLAHYGLEPLGMAERAGELGASFPTLTADGALIFSRHGPDLSRQTLMIARPVAGGWAGPDVLDVGGDHSDRSPAMLLDGSSVIFASDRPRVAGASPDGYRLWFARRLASGDWDSPQPVDFDGGWDHDARQPSVTADGTLYFSSSAPGGRGQGDIYVAAPVAPGRWATPRNLGEPINGPLDEHGAFVAPDGSYMILTSADERPGSLGGDDLYLSFRTGGGWSPPGALELPVNTFANEYGAWVSPLDGSLYFTSDRYGHADIFRVDARAAGLSTSGNAQPVRPNAAILVYDGVQVIDHAIPYEVFGQFALNNVYIVAETRTRRP